MGGWGWGGFIWALTSVGIGMDNQWKKNKVKLSSNWGFSLILLYVYATERALARKNGVETTIMPAKKFLRVKNLMALC